MRNQIPKLNQGVAKAQGTVIMLEKQNELFKKEEAHLRAKLKAAALSNEDAIGQEIALQLQRTIDQRAKITETLKTAYEGLNSLKKLRDTQIMKIKRETEKIKDALEDHRVAKLKGELAELFESYEVGDLAYSNEEMLQKIQEETAINEGKLESVKDLPEMKEIELEQRAQRIQAKDLYEQFKSEMNIDVSANDNKGTEKSKKAQKTIG